MRASLLSTTVAKSTRVDYEAKFRRVEKAVGRKVCYESLVEYAFLNEDKAATTMKQMKSACAYVLRCRGEPLTAFEDEDLNRVYDGLFDRPTPLANERKWRGDISGNRLDQLLDELCQKGPKGVALAEACSVMYECTLRPHDVEEFSSRHIVMGCDNGEPPYVISMRKAKAVAKDRLGKYEAHPIMSRECSAYLESKTSLAPDQRMFPDWDAAVLNRYIRECAVKHGWPPQYQWVVHGIRHGAATKELKLLWGQIGKNLGAWRGRAAEDYAGLGHGHPLNVEARRTVQFGAGVGTKRKRDKK
jgi:hypothetical protein